MCENTWLTWDCRLFCFGSEHGRLLLSGRTQTQQLKHNLGPSVRTQLPDGVRSSQTGWWDVTGGHSMRSNWCLILSRSICVSSCFMSVSLQRLLMKLCGELCVFAVWAAPACWRDLTLSSVLCSQIHVDAPMMPLTWGRKAPAITKNQSKSVLIW